MLRNAYLRTKILTFLEDNIKSKMHFIENKYGKKKYTSKSQELQFRNK